MVQCPPGYFGDITGDGTVAGTYICKKVCTQVTEYGNPLTRVCVVKANCQNPYIYADDFSRQCVTKCPASQNTWGDAGSNYCSLTCPWVVGNYLYKDPSTQKCVADCPVNPSLFKDNGTQFCVSFCTSPNFAVVATR